MGNLDVQISSVVPDVGFASPEFVGWMANALEGARYVMGVSRNYSSFVLPYSGTGAMESVTSLLRKGERVLVASNGVFGDRWEGILSRYPVRYKFLRSEPGKAVSVQEIDRELQNGYDVFITTHVETSTGVRMPIEEVSKVVRDRVSLIVVDGVASVGGEAVSAEDWKVDVFFTASQKAVGAQPGTSLMVCSGRAMERLGGESMAPFYLDLRNWKPIMDGMETGIGGYFATPPVGAVASLSRAMDLIRNEGMKERVRRHERVASIIREGVEEMGLRVLAEEGLRSNTVTAVLLDREGAGEIVKRSMELGIEFATGPHPALRDRYFRIGHMGWVQEKDAFAALSVLRRVVS